LSLSLSGDAFAAAFAYGCMGTRIPIKSAGVINIVCTAFLAAAIIAGGFAAGFVPEIVGVVLCFTVLMTIGVIKLVQGIRRNPKSADSSDSASGLCPANLATASLRPGEAAILAAGLSLDGLAAGFGAGLGGVNGVVMLTASIAAHMAAIPLGCMLGRQLSSKSRCNIAWVGGVVIILLAFMQLI
jgi:putative Mn2+ efflux pump MntP